MKTIKQSNQIKKVGTILMSFFIIIIVGITVSFVLENKSKAEEAKVTCSKNSEHEEVNLTGKYDDEYHQYYCKQCLGYGNEEHSFSEETSSGNSEEDTHDVKKTCKICGYVLISKANCEYGETAEYRDTTYHARFCIDENCGAEKLFEHEDKDNDFICDWTGCEYVMHTHVYTYSERYVTNNDGTHKVIGRCECGEEQDQEQAPSESCDAYYGEATYTEEEHHSRTCERCKYASDEKCEGATHDNGGKCEVCKQVIQVHNQTGELIRYDITDDTHTPIYSCSYEGCKGEYEGASEKHKDGNHENDGICQVTGCGHQYQKHTKSDTIKGCKVESDGHTLTYKCSFEECEGEYEGTKEEHYDGNHENGGICQLKECGYKYQTHEQSDTIKEYNKSKDGHTPVYYCTYSGCTETFDGAIEEHSGGTHQNGGICTVEGCGYQYETHEQSTIRKQYKKTEDGHTPIYYCTHSGCDVTYDGEIQEHSGATHENGGICTVEGCRISIRNT